MGEPTYRLEVTYAADAAGAEPQVHTGLRPELAEQGTGAFVRDLIGLGGRGVRRVVIEVEERSGD